MLGIFRYVLAMMVACSHLWTELLWWQGTYAVFCFYVVSGYLMTLILNETYIGDRGWLRYLENRALRIYPVYWVVLALTLGFSMGLPGLADTRLWGGLELRHVVRQADSLQSWLANITLLIPVEGAGLAVSQAWSLRIEMIFYIAMIFLVKSRPRVIAWAVVSVGFVAWQQLNQVPFIERYTGVLGSSLAFSLGSLVYHYRDGLQLSAIHVPISLGLFALHTVFAAELWGFSRNGNFGLQLQSHHYGLYVATLFGAYALAAMQSEVAAGIGGWAGKLLGDLAYPVFLVHWLVGGLLIATGVSFQNKLVLVPMAFLLINLLALLLNRAVERPIETGLRSRVRPSPNAGNG